MIGRDTRRTTDAAGSKLHATQRAHRDAVTALPDSAHAALRATAIRGHASSYRDGRVNIVLHGFYLQQANIPQAHAGRKHPPADRPSRIPFVDYNTCLHA